MDKGLGYAKKPGPPADEMFRYRSVIPFFALTKTFNTRQVSVDSTPRRVIQTLRPMVYAIANTDPNDSIFFGNRHVTLQNGFPLIAQEVRIFGMAENSELWAVSTNPMTLYILEMGV